MKAKARVPDPRREQPERLAANEAGCGRNSLRCASMRRKIALNRPGIRGMSAQTHASLRRPRSVHARRRPTPTERDGETMLSLATLGAFQRDGFLVLPEI